MHSVCRLVGLQRAQLVPDWSTLIVRPPTALPPLLQTIGSETEKRGGAIFS
jgi:hypothetical protein